MNRRTFLTSMLAACAAPAIVRADSLMRIVARDVGVIPVEYGCGRRAHFVVTGLGGIAGMLNYNIGDIITFDGMNVIQVWA